ncbi:MAG: metallophosphoesterase family protein [Pseudomonadota bacterium]
MENPIIDVGNRAFVLGGAYGNLQATQAILAKAKDLGFSSSQIIFTGDTVAYCGQPAETVALLRDSGIHVIMGNCEESLGEDSDNCGCGFEEGTECNLLSVEWYRFCQNALDTETKRWMSQLPKSVIFQIGHFRLECLHGTPSAINEFVFPSDIENGRITPPENPDIDGYITGHSGIPFVAGIEGKAWINSGAAGMPANDGTNRVWFATVESANHGLIAETHPVSYDFKSASHAMKKAGLNNGYRECLSSGIWPSHDVLPQAEKLKTGIRQQPERLVFEQNSTDGLPGNTYPPEAIAS